MFEVGRLCIKTAGRDAGKHCIVIEAVDGNTVLIDGETRRRKVNVKHLEPLNKVIELRNGTLHEDVKREFEKLGMKVLETKKKEKKEKPRKIRKGKREKRTSEPAVKKKGMKKRMGKELIKEITPVKESGQ